MERLKVFNSLLENVRQLMCERDVKSETDLEQLISLVLTIGLEELDLDDINSILSTLLKYIKNNTNEFPSLLLLSYVKKILEYMAFEHRQKLNNSAYISLSWPNDLRLIIQRFFQTFKIPEDYLIYCYDLSYLATKTIGLMWFYYDPKYAVLLASLTSGRLRIILENEQKINIEQLISCLSLLEDFMECIESDNSTDYIDDNAATSISKSCQESATFICECIITFTNKNSENSIARKMEYLLVVYRFLCAFISIGGAKIIDQTLLSQILFILLKVCKFCIDQRDYKTSSLLLLNLNEFEQLNDNILDIILEYFRLIIPTVHFKRGLIQICSILEQLVNRKNWYTEKSLADAHNLASFVKDKRLNELLNKLV